MAVEKRGGGGGASGLGGRRREGRPWHVLRLVRRVPSARLSPAGLPVVQTGRGGQWTWHGPGQMVLWPVLDLNQRRRDVRAYIFALEGWMIDVLACFGVSGERREGKPGIWVRRGNEGQPDRLDKIVAVGVRISKWVTMHGVALNHEPDLTQ